MTFGQQNNVSELSYEAATDQQGSGIGLFSFFDSFVIFIERFVAGLIPPKPVSTYIVFIYIPELGHIWDDLQKKNEA